MKTSSKISSIPKFWESAQLHAPNSPTRFEQSVRDLVKHPAGIKKRVQDYYRNYQNHVVSHRPKSNVQIGAIDPKRLKILKSTGFTFEPFNNLARKFGWPEIDLEHSREACEHYNQAGRHTELFESVFENFESVAELVDELVVNLVPNTPEGRAKEIDLFLVAGSSGPERAIFTADLITRFNSPGMLLSMGDRARYMGDTQFDFTEAEAACLSVLINFPGFSSKRLLLETHSRITNDHPIQAEPFISAVHRSLKRPIRIAAVTSQFHSARFSYLLCKHFESILVDACELTTGQIESIDSFAIPIPIHKNSPRLGHVLNEYVKILFELCYQENV